MIQTPLKHEKEGEPTNSGLLAKKKSKNKLNALNSLVDDTFDKRRLAKVRKPGTPRKKT
jgi:hypothetical protein